MPPNYLIADRAYDAQSLRDWLKDRRIIATIPSTATRTVSYPLSRKACRRRNRIARLFGHLRNWRRVATRYDRLACNYLAAVALAVCIVSWLRISPLPKATFSRRTPPILLPLTPTRSFRVASR